MRGLLSLSAASLLLASCASVPHVSPQVQQLTPASVGIGDRGQAMVADNWWHAFGDPQLDRLIDMGLSGSPDLAAALARARMADAAIQQAGAASKPQIALDAKAPRQRLPENYIVPPPYGGMTTWVPQIEASLGWDLDLFGRNKAAVRQARAEAEAAKLDAAAARLALSVGIAQTYIAFAKAQQQIAVADGFVATRQKALQLVNVRIQSKLASQFDLEQAQTLLAEAEQYRVRAGEQRDATVHALAALVGRGADFYGSITAPSLGLATPPPVPLDLPADLLGRRPDLLAGQARIDAATAGREHAKAEFLPDISIQALVGTVALGLGNAFKAGSIEYGVGPAIHLPIFEGGRLKAQYKGAVAGLDEAVADYNSSVLKAVRDAADAATHVGAADRDLAAQTRIVAGLRETVRLDRVRTNTGLGSQLDAVASGFRLLEAEQQLVDLQAQALVRRVQLFAALGGGFETQSTDKS